MTVSNATEVRDGEEIAVALKAARSLGRALGESSAFKRFEAAYDVFQADDGARQKLSGFQSRQRELRTAAMWGGVDEHERQELEREWRTISEIPSLSDYLRAQEELTTLFREVAGRVSEAVGVDFGAACSPSGGCC